MAEMIRTVMQQSSWEGASSRLETRDWLCFRLSMRLLRPRNSTVGVTRGRRTGLPGWLLDLAVWACCSLVAHVEMLWRLGGRAMSSAGRD